VLGRMRRGVQRRSLRIHGQAGTDVHRHGHDLTAGARTRGSMAPQKPRSRHMGDSARPSMTDFRGDGELHP
jgi:hypothetical protein